MIWAGTGTVYGWGHNHRGQLGGVSGVKVKAPILCSSIAAIKPVQIIGGEQTFFFVNSDGKVKKEQKFLTNAKEFLRKNFINIKNQVFNYIYVFSRNF